MSIKQKLYQLCLEAVNQRLLVCEKSLKDLQESLASETKSSAGDKHETGRAMIQLEREQLGGQLKIIEEEKAVLLKINPDQKTEIVHLGSLVKTTQNNYFIAISVGKIVLYKNDFYAISLNSPIGQILAGKRVGDKVHFRDQEMEILEIE